MPERNPEPAHGRPERRAFVRLASDLAATCHPSGHSDAVSWPGRVCDLSRGGVGLALRHRFRPGTRLTVELRASTGACLHTVGVVVIHARAVIVDGDHCWLLGCAFDRPLEDEESAALL